MTIEKNLLDKKNLNQKGQIKRDYKSIQNMTRQINLS